MNRAFYINAAYRKDRTLVWLSVLRRMVAVFVFQGHGGVWRKVAGFEGVCGVSIAGA